MDESEIQVLVFILFLVRFQGHQRAEDEISSLSAEQEQNIHLVFLIVFEFYEIIFFKAIAKSYLFSKAGKEICHWAQRKMPLTLEVSWESLITEYVGT